MRYFGGKARIAKQLAEFLQSQLKEGQPFVDAFCGSCNVVSKINAPVRIANDLHAELIAMHKAVQDGWIPPSSVSEVEYTTAKTGEATSYLKAFVGFGLSYSGKYFGGYARDGSGRNYCLNAKNSLLLKHKDMKDVDFTQGSYNNILVPRNSLLYCDIPYKDTTKYSTGSFSHEEFYSWAIAMKEQGHNVLVSEYRHNLPEGWEIVWELESKKDIRNKEGVQEKTVEILMTPC